MKNREIRYQGAIVRHNRILLIRHQEHKSGRSYWILPGGGIEPGETEADCVRRELKEETDLDVRVISLLLDEPDPTSFYRQWKTYLCESTAGEASPGYEPEPEVASQYRIAELKWFRLDDELEWPAALVSNTYTYNHLKRIIKKLNSIG
jgi:ADP-ribose pyrophosphatase YjhB (NUDIX family)